MASSSLRRDSITRPSQDEMKREGGRRSYEQSSGRRFRARGCSLIRGTPQMNRCIGDGDDEDDDARTRSRDVRTFAEESNKGRKH